MRCALVHTRMLMVGRVPVVFRQQILAPVTVEVAPYAMNVVGVVLGIVVLDQKCAALHAIVMTLAFFQTTHPCEFDLIEARVPDLVESWDSLCSWLRTQVFLDQRHQRALLVFAELAIGDALVVLNRGLPLIARQYVIGRGSVDHS